VDALCPALRDLVCIDAQTGMNRTQAVERIDEILDLFAEMYASGCCPRCGVPLYVQEDRRLAAETSVTRTVVHRPPCELASGTEELARLTRRFAIRLEPVLLTLSEPKTSVLTVPRIVD
jgi:hypothetical protein